MLEIWREMLRDYGPGGFILRALGVCFVTLVGYGWLILVMCL